MKHNIKISLGGYLILALTLLASSCISDPLHDNGVDPPVPEGKVRIGLYTDAGDFQRPVSRAAADENSAAGTTSRMPWVFVFSGVGSTALLVEVKQSVPVGNPVVPHVVLIERGSPVEVLILANAPEQFSNGSQTFDFTEANLAMVLDDATLSDAYDFLRTIDLTSTAAIPYDGGYLPMVGSISLPNITASTSIGSGGSNVLLTRIVAKVTVTKTAENFTLDRWSVIGAKRNTRFFDSAVAVGNLMDFDDGVAEEGIANPFYLYPSAGGETSVIVRGMYNGIANQYYKLAFKDFTTGSTLPIERNNWYKVDIVSVTGTGYSSFNDAKLAAPSNNMIAAISVVDLSAYDVTDNGDYYLGLSNSQVLFYGFPESAELPYTAVTVSTNATVAEVGGSVNSVSLIDVNGTLTLTTNSLNLSAGTTQGVTDVKISAIGTDFISGKIVIRLGNLIRAVEVRKVSGGLSFTEGSTKLNFQSDDIYTTAELATPAEALWLAFSPDGVNTVSGSYTQPNAAALTPVYLHTRGNIASVGAVSRRGEVYLSRKAEGRVKAYVRQKALNIDLDCSATVVHGNYRSGYTLDDSHYIAVKIKSDVALTGYDYDVQTTVRNRIHFHTSGTFGTDAVLNDGEYEYNLNMQGYGTLFNEGGSQEVYTFLLPILSNAIVADTCLTQINVGNSPRDVFAIDSGAADCFSDIPVQ